MTRRYTIAPRRVFFDLESGGFDPTRHPIIQMAAVAFDAEWNERERFEVKLKFDEAHCDPDALKKVSYDRRLWHQHAVEPITAHRRFSYFLRDHSTVAKTSQKNNARYHVARLFAHNSGFDASFLWRWHDSLRTQCPDLFLPADRHLICTMQTALIYFDQAPAHVLRPVDYKLGTLCEYFRVPFSTNEAHDALYDCLACAKLFHAMTAADSQKIELKRAA